MNADVYVDEVLWARVVPFFREHKDIAMFQQDNARLHTAAVAKTILTASGIDVLDWPAKSPDKVANREFLG